MNEQLKQEVVDEILENLEVELSLENPYLSSYEVFKVTLKYNGAIITEDTINNKYLGKGE